MRNSRVLRQFVLRKLARAPIISVQISALDVVVVCQALSLWMALFLPGKTIKDLFTKLRNTLFNLLPQCKEEIKLLLVRKKWKTYGNSKTNSQA